jgi:hypothetical protein
VLRVRQFQPAHALIITELCGENLRIPCSNAACLFFKFPLTFLVCIVFSVWNISDCHTQPFLIDMHNYLAISCRVLFVCWFVFHCHGNKIIFLSMMADLEGI